jgi:hypothetical protein
VGDALSGEICFAEGVGVGSEVGDRVGSDVGDRVCSELGDGVDSAVGGDVGFAVGDAMGTPPGGDGFAVGVDEGICDPVGTQPFLSWFRTSPIGH